MVGRDNNHACVRVNPGNPCLLYTSGVAVKEKLKRLKLNVDTITMTATPIPRTLQFSLMGARDMSIIRTAPPNRYPIVTELHRFDEKVIKDAISYEVSRGGQVFFIHNRVDNIRDIQYMIHRLIPGIKSCVGHGQMSGEELETVMPVSYTHLGNFREVDVEDLTKHKMDSEQIFVTPETVKIVNDAKDEKHKICAVGTTVVRTLESCVTTKGRLTEFEGWTNK